MNIVRGRVAHPIRSLLHDINLCTCADEVKQFHDVVISHSYAPDRARFTQLNAVGAAMDIDITAHRVDIAKPIDARFAPGQPENARQHPVAFRKTGTEIRRIRLTCRATACKYRVLRTTSTDFGANNVPPARGTEAAKALAHSIFRGRYHIGAQWLSCDVAQPEILLGNIYEN